MARNPTKTGSWPATRRNGIVVVSRYFGWRRCYNGWTMPVVGRRARGLGWPAFSLLIWNIELMPDTVVVCARRSLDRHLVGVSVSDDELLSGGCYPPLRFGTRVAMALAVAWLAMGLPSGTLAGWPKPESGSSIILGLGIGGLPDGERAYGNLGSRVLAAIAAKGPDPNSDDTAVQETAAQDNVAQDDVAQDDVAQDDVAQDDEFRLGSSDHLTLIGATMVERLQYDGLLEAALYQQVGSGSLQIRNLGWSGDDVWGTARAVFGQPSDGFQRLKQDLQQTQPTAVLVAYGANESFTGPEGLDKFRGGLGSLLDMVAETGARAVLVTPPPFENPGPPLPDMEAANRNLQLYSQAIREIAVQRKLPLIDLHRQLASGPPPQEPRMENGIHLTSTGRQEVSRLLAAGLLGRSVTEEDWQNLQQSPDLLQLIQKKNELHFHRYRPQNETYLFLFRKHEQGNNAVEIPQFDELVRQVEQQIRHLVHPSSP